MTQFFPNSITKLPQADIPLDGITAYLSQSKTHQIIFLEAAEEVQVPAHAHESQWVVVLDGQIDLTIDGETTSYRKGDNFFVPEGVTHAAKIYAGYKDIIFFDQPDRYPVK